MSLSNQLQEAFGKPEAEVGDERKWKAGTFVKTAKGWIRKAAEKAKEAATKEKASEVAKKAAEKGKTAAKGISGAARKLVSDADYRAQVGKQAGEAIRRKSKKTAEHIVDELKELKDAGAALKKVGLRQELTGHDKKALKAAAKVIGTTVAGTVVMGGIGHLTVAALAEHFVAETLLKSAGRAALFASFMPRGGWLFLEQSEEEQVQGLVDQILKHVAQEFENLGSMSSDEIEKILAGIEKEG